MGRAENYWEQLYCLRDFLETCLSKQWTVQLSSSQDSSSLNWANLLAYQMTLPISTSEIRHRSKAKLRRKFIAGKFIFTNKSQGRKKGMSRKAEGKNHKKYSIMNLKRKNIKLLHKSKSCFFQKKPVEIYKHKPLGHLIKWGNEIAQKYKS